MRPRTRLAELRQSLKTKTSQYRMAVILGLTNAHYQGVEVGRSKPSIDVAFRIAAHFRVPVDSLWHLTEVGVEARPCHSGGGRAA